MNGNGLGTQKKVILFLILLFEDGTDMIICVYYKGSLATKERSETKGRLKEWGPLRRLARGHPWASRHQKAMGKIIKWRMAQGSVDHLLGILHARPSVVGGLVSTFKKARRWYQKNYLNTFQKPQTGDLGVRKEGQILSLGKAHSWQHGY